MTSAEQSFIIIITITILKKGGNKMIKIKRDVWLYRGYDVFHSPDEGGYYAAQGDKVSKIFKTRDAIQKAIASGKIKLK